MTTSVKPVYWLISFVFVQVRPPSLVLYRPRSPPAAQSGPTAATYTTLGSRGSITMRPMCCDFGSIGADHVRPPSVDLYTPLPHDELRMFCGSPVPTQMTSGFDGATAIAPIDGARTESNSDVHDTPAFVERHKPPVAAPM